MSRLVIEGQADKPDLTSLEHHGTKGMKWGVRKAGQIARDSRINANTRQINYHTQVAKRPFPLRLRSKNAHQKKISTLMESTNRLKAGKPKVQDILDIHSKVNIVDVVRAVRNTDFS